MCHGGDVGIGLTQSVRSADCHFLHNELTSSGALLLCETVRVVTHFQDGVFDQLTGGQDAAEGCVVVLLHVDLRSLAGEGVDEENQIGHLIAET